MEAEGGDRAGVVTEWKSETAPLIPTSMVPAKTHSIRVVHAALVLVQLGYAGLQMFSRIALDAGLNQFLLSMYRNMIAFAILGPIAYHFEKGVRPAMSWKILGGLNLLALTGSATHVANYGGGVPEHDPRLHLHPRRHSRV